LHPRHWQPFARQLLTRLALLAAFFCASGCGPQRKAVYPVRGRVLVDGKPAAHAQVAFHAVDAAGDPHPVGNADGDGYFSLTTYKQGDGAPAGEYLVTVLWVLATPVPGPGGGQEYQGVSHLAPRYARADTSGLRATVAPGGTELAPFQLTNP
jgi:hypothetical protein